MALRDWRPWATLVGLFLLSAGFIAYVIAPASVLPVVMAEYAIGKAAASATISAVFLAWAVLQLPAGYLMDRYDNRRLVALGASLFLLAAFAGLVAGSYPGFLFTRLASGAGIVFVFVGSVNVLDDVLPPDHRAIGIGVFIASPPFGAAIAQFASPRVTAAFGWRATLLGYTLASAVGAVVFRVALRRPVRTGEQVTVSRFVAALRDPAVLLVSFASLCTYAVWTFLNTWMPTFGNEVLGIELAAAGAATALVPLAAIASRPGGGWLAELLDGRLKPVIVGSFLGTIVLLVLVRGAPSPTAFAGLLAASGGAVNLSVGLYLVYVTGLADDATQGTSLAVLATASQVGNLIAPVLGGWIIAQVSWSAGFGMAAALAAAGVVAVLLAPPAT